MHHSQFRVTGSTRALTGSIEVRGAKNDALKAFAASPLFSGPITIKNVPRIEDIARTCELLRDLGISVRKESGRMFIVDPHAFRGHMLTSHIAEQLRASIVLAGPLLARQGVAVFPYPGGCVIGKRPIDIFLDGWKAMGVRVREKGSHYELSASRLHGADITFRTISVTATETLMMTAVLARGTTILRNVAMEPEIPHLASFLNASGAHIEGAGTSTIRIVGRRGKLLEGGGTFVTIHDRIEAGSFAILGALRGNHLKIKNCNPEHVGALLQMLKDAGAKIRVGTDWIEVSRPAHLKAIDIKTREYPGFVTDLQAPAMVLLTQARGTSLVFETIFDGRLNYIHDLNRMGAHIVMCDPHRALASGPTPLHGRELEGPDLRAGLAFIIAAAIAKGESVIGNAYQIDRGYEAIDRRLRSIGVDIRRETS